MKKLYSADDFTFVSHLKNILENNGIHCIIKNAYLRGAMGDIPPQECIPGLYIMDENQFDETQIILNDALHPNNSLPAWQCPTCKELRESQFSECWKYGYQQINHQ